MKIVRKDIWEYRFVLGIVVRVVGVVSYRFIVVVWLICEMLGEGICWVVVKSNNKNLCRCGRNKFINNDCVCNGGWLNFLRIKLGFILSVIIMDRRGRSDDDFLNLLI